MQKLEKVWYVARALHRGDQFLSHQVVGETTAGEWQWSSSAYGNHKTRRVDIKPDPSRCAESRGLPTCNREQGLLIRLLSEVRETAA